MNEERERQKANAMAAIRRMEDRPQPDLLRMEERIKKLETPQPDLLRMEERIKKLERSLGPSLSWPKVAPPRSIRAAIYATADFYSVPLEEIVKASGLTQEMVNRRQIATYVARQFGHSLVQIGKLMKRDHTTLSHNCKKIERLIGTDETLRAHVDAIQKSASARINRPFWSEDDNE